VIVGKRFVYGLIAVGVLVVIGYFVYINFPLSSKPEIDMYQKIREEISNGYSVLQYDWMVWSRTFGDSGGILTKMDNWEQFKESYNQSFGGPIMLDEQNRVVWFKGSAIQAVYYAY